MSFSEWREVTLSDITIGNKGDYGIGASAVEYSKDLYTYLRITDISDDGILKKESLMSVDDENSKNYLLKPNDIVFARTGNSTGRSYFYDGSDGELVYAGFLIKFSLDPSKVNPKFIRYYTLSNEYKDWVSSFSTGSTRSNINAKTYGNMKIKLPPTDQQDFLVRILSTIDDKIEVNNQINKTLENMAQAIFKQWFVDFEFPNEDGEPYKSSGGEMVESELGMIPKGWEVVHLKDKLNFERGIEPGSKNYSKTYFERSIPFYRVGDMLGIAKNYVDKNLINDKTLKTRDVAVSFDGTVGRVVTGLRGSYSTGIRKIYAKKGEYFPNCFIYFLFKTEFIQSTIMQYAVGTTILHASESIEYLAIPYHEEIIKKFVPIIEAIFNTIVNKKKENESLSNTRDILLPKLMSGEIRVPLDEECDAS